MIAAISLLSVITCLGATGNLLVIKTILNVKRRKLYEYLILNLAITDAGTSLVSIPLDIAEQVKGEFPYGAAMCHVIYPLQSVLIYVSVLTLLLMSTERYKLIVTPMKPRMHIKTAFIIIAAMWVLSCLIVLPFSAALKLEGNQCSEHWPKVYSGKAFTLTIFIFLYFVPLSVMIFLYSWIIFTFYKDMKTLKVRVRKRSVSIESINLRLHRNARIVKVFVAAVVVFAMCMLPTHIVWLWHDFGQGSSSPLFGRVSTFSNIFMYTNSVLNPFILGFVMTDGKGYLRKLFCCRLRRSTSPRRKQAFVLRTQSPSMSKHYNDGSPFLSLSKAPICDQEIGIANKTNTGDSPSLRMNPNKSNNVANRN